MLDRVAAVRFGQRGKSSPELYATWLWYPVFGGFSSYGAVVAWRSHLGNTWLAAVNEKGCTTATMLSLTSAVVGASSIDRTMLETGKTGAAEPVGYRRGVGSARAAPQ
jgi:hypothetical protein